MSPDKISTRVVADRLAFIKGMISEIRNLPLSNWDTFCNDHRNVFSAESCLRRCLEALFDLGRHILVKGFAQGVSEYKEVAAGVAGAGVVQPEDGSLLRVMAGYRNRLVHFYHEVSVKELYEICVHHLTEIERVSENIRQWLVDHPEKMDQSL